MITEWTTPFVEAKDEFIAWLRTQEFPSYESMLKKSVEIIRDSDSDWPYGEEPDPSRIHRIDDGDYQGTLVFVIGSSDYQPDRYWVTKVSYGSCSGCDSLEAAIGWSEDSHDFEALYTLALHMLQGAKEI